MGTIRRFEDLEAWKKHGSLRISFTSLGVDRYAMQIFASDTRCVTHQFRCCQTLLNAFPETLTKNSFSSSMFPEVLLRNYKLSFTLR